MTPPRFALKNTGLSILRDIGFPVVAVAGAITLPFHYLVYTFIILGQAHFIIAYLYQWRGKRMTRGYLIVALLLLVVFVAYFSLGGTSMPLLVLISILFSFHFALDELTLHDEQPTPGGLISVGGFTLAFSLLSLIYIFPDVSWLPYTAGLVGVGAIGLRFLFERTWPARGERYLWFVQTLLFATALYFHLPAHGLAMIVIIHVVNWYVAYGVRLAPIKARARQYWLEVLASLAVVASLFLFFLSTHLGVLALFFGIGPYYAWAVAHILLSLLVALPRRVQGT
jgi:hypothetical protein